MEVELGTRLNVVRWATCAGLLSAMALCPRLWLGERSFPVITAFPFVPLVPAWLAASLLAAFVLSIIAVAVPRGPRWTIVAALLTGGLLVLFDITRLQPWFYQYLLLLAALLAKDRASAWRLCAIIVAFGYFASGYQKLNLAFGDEIFPWLISSKVGAPQLGLSVAFIEAAIGMCLLIPRTRAVALVGAVGLHLFVLGVLGPLGHNFNNVVWPWNLCLPLIAAALFLKNKGDVLLTAMKSMAGRVVFVVVGVLPTLSLINLWDDNLSSSLYSGRTFDAYLHMSAEQAAKAGVPLWAMRAVDDGMAVEVTGWAFADMGVPPYPAPRIYHRMAKELPGSRLFIRTRTLLGGASHEFEAQ